MEAIVKTNYTQTPWIKTYCPNCKALLTPTDIFHRTVHYCHLCGTKVEFNNYFARLKTSKTTTDRKKESQ